MIAIDGWRLPWSGNRRLRSWGVVDQRGRTVAVVGLGGEGFAWGLVRGVLVVRLGWGHVAWIGRLVVVGWRRLVFGAIGGRRWIRSGVVRVDRR